MYNTQTVGVSEPPAWLLENEPCHPIFCLHYCLPIMVQLSSIMFL